MSVGIWQILLLVVLFMLLFGRGKVPQLMSDLAQGIRNFKAGIKEDDAAADAQAGTVTNTPALPDSREQPANTSSVAGKVGQ